MNKKMTSIPYCVNSQFFVLILCLREQKNKVFLFVYLSYSLRFFITKFNTANYCKINKWRFSYYFFLLEQEIKSDVALEKSYHKRLTTIIELGT